MHDRDGSFEEGSGAPAPTGRPRFAIRVARMVLGTVLVIAGVVLLFIPGPGWLTIALGLTLLAEDSKLAERLLRRVRDHLPGDEQEKTVLFWVILALISLSGLALSAWFLVRR